MRTPVFPPLLTGQAVSAGVDPVAMAADAADAGRAGAGDLFWLRDDRTAHCAVVLEPESKAVDALCMIPLAMVAAADALGSIGEANLAITHRWPAILMANGAQVGRVDMRFPNGIGGGVAPAYAVLSFRVEVQWPAGFRFEPGEREDRTVLHEEGCGAIGTVDVLESWSRHLLSWVDTWANQGFRPVGENWLFRAHDRNRPVSITVRGERVEGILAGIDDKGGALVKQAEGSRLVALEDIWFPGGRDLT